MQTPEYRFPPGFTQRDFDEMADRELASNVRVRLEDGREAIHTFMTVRRLEQEASLDFARGEPCYWEQGIVVVPEVTREAIQRAVEHMWRSGYWKRE